MRSNPISDAVVIGGSVMCLSFRRLTRSDKWQRTRRIHHLNSVLGPADSCKQSLRSGGHGQNGFGASRGNRNRFMVHPEDKLLLHAIGLFSSFSILGLMRHNICVLPWFTTMASVALVLLGSPQLQKKRECLCNNARIRHSGIQDWSKKDI
jgi:hypothetical protein